MFSMSTIAMLLVTVLGLAVGGAVLFYFAATRNRVDWAIYSVMLIWMAAASVHGVRELCDMAYERGRVAGHQEVVSRIERLSEEAHSLEKSLYMQAEEIVAKPDQQ